MRPERIGLGRGGYGEIIWLQDKGDHITDDMITKGAWSRDPMGPLIIEDKSGQVTDIIPSAFKVEDFPSDFFEAPPTPYELLNPETRES